METKLTEFSYGYAVTAEIIKKEGAQTAAPIFPSLYDEGKKKGFDVQIQSATPIFLQFKLSDYLKDKRAKQYGTFNAPFYRFSIRPKYVSQQHQLLVDLEQSGESVFYIAPEFHLATELDLHYLNEEVVSHSAAFSPQEIGIIHDDEEHHVCFERGTSHGYFFSEPKKIPKKSLDDLKALLKERKPRPVKTTIVEISRNIAHALERNPIKTEAQVSFDYDMEAPAKMVAYKKTISESDQEAKRNRIIEHLRDDPTLELVDRVTKTFFGSQLLFIPKDYPT